MRRVLVLVVVLVAGCGSSSTPASDGAAGVDGLGTTDGLAGADASPSDGAAGGEVDPSTMARKLLFGYQGWFFCPGDGAPMDRWVHWFRDQAPDADHATIDMWPEPSALDAGERCATSMTLPGGAPATVYSAWNPATVARHFRWMKDHGVDGVFLQRFLSELGDAAFLAARDRVTANVRAGAEAEGRVWAVMYDISGANESTLVADLEADWTHLTGDLGVTASPRYLHHRGKPVVAIWGFGFGDRPGTTAQAAEVITWFQTQATVVGGVPRDWRDDAVWRDLIRTFDVVSPWTVGAFVDDAGADAYRPRLEADLADLTARGRDYLPVVFPGFSWHNLNAGPLNQIPRRGGRFWWHQLYNAVDGGATMVYGAMFDEVDEGTAMFAIAPTAAEQPAQGSFLPLDADGESLPSDWYLRLAGEGTRMLRGALPLTPDRPIDP
jgi:hypothetical protein